MSSRHQLASLLDASGLSRLLLMARTRPLYPWRWLTVLTYHRVSEQVAPGYDPDVVDATPAVFEEQVKFLKQYFTFMDTRDLEAWRAGGRLPSNPVMMTFDDGYRDNHDVVMPIIKKHGAKAVFFVATECVSERRVFWWERVNHALLSSSRARVTLQYPQPIELPLDTLASRRAAIETLLRLLKKLPAMDMQRFVIELYAACGVRFDRDEERRMAEGLVMTWDQIRALRDGGMDVQSHSHAHRVLNTLSPDEATRDLLHAREQLEDQLNQPVIAVAYPTGRPIRGAPGLRKAVLAAGYRYGFTVEKLVPLAEMRDWLGIPRMMIDRAVNHSFFRSTLALPRLAY